MNTVQKVTASAALLLSIVAAILMAAGPELVLTRPQNGPLYTSPLFFPFMALGLVLISGIALAVKSLKGLRIVLDLDVQTTLPRLRLITAVLGIFALYTVLIPLLGYFLSSMFFLTSALFLVGFRGGALLLRALGCAIFLYLLFIIGLDVWFPDSWLIQQMQ